MATIPEQIQEIIKDYINKIRNQIPVEKAFLFGSYAQGNYTPDSDVDLAIFSSHFEQMERIDGFRFLFLQAMDYGIDLQPQPFSLQDFREPLGIVEEIIKNGIEV